MAELLRDVAAQAAKNYRSHGLDSKMYYFAVACAQLEFTAIESARRYRDQRSREVNVHETNEHLKEHLSDYEAKVAKLDNILLEKLGAYATHFFVHQAEYFELALIDARLDGVDIVVQEPIPA